MKVKSILSALCLVSGLIAISVFAGEVPGVNGYVRVGVIETEDQVGDSSEGSALGGKLGYITSDWQGLSAGISVYTTQELADNENGDFFATDNMGYTLVGEAYVKGALHNTTLKLGRFEIDTPYADTDDIRMVPNTFQGAVISNEDFIDTVVTFVFLDEWAGVDADIPEKYKDINGDGGVFALGVEYYGFDAAALQAWFYKGRDLASLVYVEGIYETEQISIGIQYGWQSDDTVDDSGPDGEVYGVSASYTVDDIVLSAAYNDVSGTVIDGFGGGPYFTSADDHTVGEVEDQQAVNLGFEYVGIHGITLGLIHADFNSGSNETDYYAIYESGEGLVFELIYTDLHEEGHFVRLMGNYYF
ncbi:MAG: OprD family outer membrane porin [Candidatus Thiodiazotropha endolucinida]